MQSISQAQGALRSWRSCCRAPRCASWATARRRYESACCGAGDLVLVRPGAQRPGRRRGGRGQEQRQRGDDHRRVAAGGEDRGRAGDRRRPRTAAARCASGDGHRRADRARRHHAAGGQAQSSRSRAQALADRAAFSLTLVAIGAGALTLVAWLLLRAGGRSPSSGSVTVLVIACPHALGLAIPLVIAISTTLGARSGLLVRDRRGLEEARHLNAVVFDKTGTLTLGEHRVVETYARSAGLTEHEALRLAAAVERDSEHPIAQAIVTSARRAWRGRAGGHGVRGDPGPRRARGGRGAGAAGRRAEPAAAARRRAAAELGEGRRARGGAGAGGDLPGGGRPCARRLRGRRRGPPGIGRGGAAAARARASRWRC